MQKLPQILQSLDLEQINNIFIKTLQENANTLNLSLAKGFLMPVVSLNSVATRNSIYYSIDSAKLVYIDSSGIVHPLHLTEQTTVADASTQDLTGANTVDKTKLEADLTSCKNAINTIIDRLQVLELIA